MMELLGLAVLLIAGKLIYFKFAERLYQQSCPEGVRVKRDAFEYL